MDIDDFTTLTFLLGLNLVDLPSLLYIYLYQQHFSFHNFYISHLFSAHSSSFNISYETGLVVLNSLSFSFSVNFSHF